MANRTVTLMAPFEHQGRAIDAITLAPVKLDHMLRWKEGRFSSGLALLSELSGIEEPALREMRYPDVDRVMAELHLHLPSVIRTDLEGGHVPPPASGSRQPTEAAASPEANAAALPDDWAVAKASEAEAQLRPSTAQSSPDDTGLGFDVSD